MENLDPKWRKGRPKAMQIASKLGWELLHRLKHLDILCLVYNRC